LRADRPIMLVVAGPPGSGKSVAFPVRASGLDHFNVDDRFGATVYQVGRPRGNRSMGTAVVGYAVTGAAIGVLSLLVGPPRGPPARA
jgi:hypothetical protein